MENIINQDGLVLCTDNYRISLVSVNGIELVVPYILRLYDVSLICDDNPILDGDRVIIARGASEKGLHDIWSIFIYDTVIIIRQFGDTIGIRIIDGKNPQQYTMVGLKNKA